MISKKLVWIAGVIAVAIAVFSLGCSHKELQQGTGVHHHTDEHAQIGMPKAIGGEFVAQKTCPVMGGTIDKNLYVDHNGKRVYVCCSGCIDAVKKNPEKYIKELEEKGEKVEDID